MQPNVASSADGSSSDEFDKATADHAVTGGRNFNYLRIRWG
jgi:hypothetical protein